MRHQKSGKKLGRTSAHRDALWSNMVCSLITHERVQTTDAKGVVAFDTCFPGWYRGRAVHIHFQVKNGATSYRISQLFFPEDITADIFNSHADYKGYGQPDTVFSNDNVMATIPTDSRARHILAVSQMSDGAMLASKVVTVV